MTSGGRLANDSEDDRSLLCLWRTHCKISDDRAGSEGNGSKHGFGRSSRGREGAGRVDGLDRALGCPSGAVCDGTQSHLSSGGDHDERTAAITTAMLCWVVEWRFSVGAVWCQLVKVEVNTFMPDIASSSLRQS
jgi:hypothetical protein